MFWFYFSYCGIQPYLVLYVWSFQIEVASAESPCLLTTSTLWVFWNVLPNQGMICGLALQWCINKFWFGSLAGCSSLEGTTCLKAAVGALLLCVFFPWIQFSVRSSSGSLQSVKSMAPLQDVEEGKLWTLLALGICFPEPRVGWERSEITAPVNSLNILHMCCDKFWDASNFWEKSSQFSHLQVLYGSPG